MKVQVDRRDGLTAQADVTASGVFERAEKDDTFPRTLQKEDDATRGVIKAAWARKEIKGKRKELTVFHRPDGQGPHRAHRARPTRKVHRRHGPTGGRRGRSGLQGKGSAHGRVPIGHVRRRQRTQ